MPHHTVIATQNHNIINTRTQNNTKPIIIVRIFLLGWSMWLVDMEFSKIKFKKIIKKVKNTCCNLVS
jgi:hypothetical protein